MLSSVEAGTRNRLPRMVLKSLLHAVFLSLAFPMALLSGFGRSETIYLIGAQCFAMAPGLPGDYLRIAWYRLTLSRCALESRIQFGSFFAHRLSVRRYHAILR